MKPLYKEAIAAKQYQGHTHSRVRADHLEIKMDTVVTRIEDGHKQDTETSDNTAATEAPAVRTLDTIEVADTSAQNPNPMDAALKDVSGQDLLKIFQDSTIPDVLAQPGMGNLLRDCAVQMMIETGKFKTDDAFNSELLAAAAEPPKEMLAMLEATLVKSA